jgi:hypothetical protein
VRNSLDVFFLPTLVVIVIIIIIIIFSMIVGVRLLKKCLHHLNNRNNNPQEAQATGDEELVVWSPQTSQTAKDHGVWNVSQTHTALSSDLRDVLKGQSVNPLLWLWMHSHRLYLAL